jgi:hypothetical protein
MPREIDSYELFDPIEAPEADRWAPATDAARTLLACVQGCCDIALACSRISLPAERDVRALGMLTVPVIGLADNVTALRRQLGREDTSSWPAKDREFLRHNGRELDRLIRGPLRQFRNRRAAHQDPEFIADSQGALTRPSLALVAEPLSCALGILGLLVNHNGVFVWSRIPDPARPNLVEQTTVTGPLSVRFKVEGGAMKKLVSIALASDPRHKVMEAVIRATEAYNRLVQGTGHRQLIFRPANRSAHGTMR